MVGCGLAFLLAYLDDRIALPEEVDRLFGLPALGYIPVIAGRQRLLRALPPHSPVAESYRGLRSSFRFVTADVPVSTVAISSAGPEGGKSTTAVNLALSMEADGSTVILVDTDLRRPNIHRLLGLRSAPGLTTVLAGECSLEEALHALPDRRLRVLTSGPIPVNPAELLNTPEMERLIEQLRGLADIVIFDTPPCLVTTDARVLGAKLDGMLLLAEIAETRKSDLRRTCELLDQAHIRILGVVFNKVSHPYQRYYRRYRYDYSEETGDERGNGHRHTTRALPDRPGTRQDGEFAPHAGADDDGSQKEEGLP
jgi:non-specific protein-tyrosine kinase